MPLNVERSWMGVKFVQINGFNYIWCFLDKIISTLKMKYWTLKSSSSLSGQERRYCRCCLVRHCSIWWPIPSYQWPIPTYLCQCPVFSRDNCLGLRGWPLLVVFRWKRKVHRVAAGLPPANVPSNVQIQNEKWEECWKTSKTDWLALAIRLTISCRCSYSLQIFVSKQ